jgi:hypothetical protein
MGFGALKCLMVTLLLGIAWGAVGCQKANSSDVRTPGVYAEFSVTELSSAQAKVDATLWVGGALSNTYLTLTGQDRLTAYVGSDVYPMLGHAGIFQSYSAIIPYPATDTELRVAFERGPDDISAPGSTVIVPALFALAPPAKAQYSRAVDAFEIDWSPFDPTQLVSWLVSGACVQALSEASAVDAGRLTIPAGTLKKPPDPGPDEEHHPIPPDQCTANAYVTKSRDGHVDPALSGGTFKASQERGVTFTSVP